MALQGIRSIPDAVLTSSADSSPLAPSRLGDLADEQPHARFLDELSHLLNRMRRGTKFVAAMNERQALGDWRQIERPVESAVAAANDDDIAATHRFNFAYRIEDRLAFVIFDAVERRPLRRE